MATDEVVGDVGGLMVTEDVLIISAEGKEVKSYVKMF